MDEKKFIEFRNQFFKELDSKPTWGRESIKSLFIITLNNTLLGINSEKLEK